ncbi:MAG: alpha/beta hydrolase [Acaryochloridaceae cyanobacterium RL_2_7]|nr:alpha/beta hydrolase [Acaryochloridaceae cyanobacterium RL_2_7]
MQTLLKKQSLGFFLALGCLYGLSCWAVYAAQGRIIFKPSREITETPGTLGWEYEDVSIPVSHPPENFIHGWWIPSSQENAKTLLFLHGNALNISANFFLAQHYRDLGFSVLMIDYRGYGLSDGAFPQEAWAYEDAEAAYQYLVQDRQIKPENLIVFGHSLGGAIAINLAQDHPDIAGLIVQSSFTSMERLAKTQAWPNLFPLKLLLHQRFDSIDKVPDLKMPRLWFHGADDPLIPFTMSQELHQASPGRSQVHIIAGAGHNGVADAAAIATTKSFNPLWNKPFKAIA